MHNFTKGTHLIRYLSKKTTLLFSSEVWPLCIHYARYFDQGLHSGKTRGNLFIMFIIVFVNRNTLRKVKNILFNEFS